MMNPFLSRKLSVFLLFSITALSRPYSLLHASTQGSPQPSHLFSALLLSLTSTQTYASIKAKYTPATDKQQQRLYPLSAASGEKITIHISVGIDETSTDNDEMKVIISYMHEAKQTLLKRAVLLLPISQQHQKKALFRLFSSKEQGETRYYINYWAKVNKQTAYTTPGYDLYHLFNDTTSAITPIDAKVKFDLDTTTLIDFFISPSIQSFYERHRTICCKFPYLLILFSLTIGLYICLGILCVKATRGVIDIMQSHGRCMELALKLVFFILANLVNAVMVYPAFHLDLKIKLYLLERKAANL